MIYIETGDGKVSVNVTDGGPRPDIVRIGDYYIDFKDFFCIVEHVLENTDLKEDDIRMEFLRRIKTAQIVGGWNKGRERIELEEPWSRWT